MACLKCGKKTENEQVFCSQCLAVMEEYSVRPDAHIQLPARRATPTEKKTGRKRRAPTLEEQVANLRSWRKWLAAALAAVVALAVLVGVLSIRQFRIALEQEDVEWGKNYTIINPFS